MDRLADDWETLTHGAGAVRHKRDIVRVFGADAESFLQTQITQDVSNMSPGESRWSFLLDPKGRVDALVRVWGRFGDSEILLDVDDGAGQRVIDRLNRFRIRTKVELEGFSWDYVALRGPDSRTAAESFHSELMAESQWAGTAGVDLLGPSVEIPDGIIEVDEEALELLRIDSGWPSTAHECSALVDPAPIPGELGESVVALAVSFTKGCYTGQELVVRTHSRGNNTPRRLRRLEIADEVVEREGPVASGGTIWVDGEARGTVTSLARRPGGGLLGLGLVHRSVGDPGVGEVDRNSFNPASGEAEGGDAGDDDAGARVEVQILSDLGKSGS
ncbi:MAG: hypothetical protein WBA45_17750 [Microthrixaceae bacterium]